MVNRVEGSAAGRGWGTSERTKPGGKYWLARYDNLSGIQKYFGNFSSERAAATAAEERYHETRQGYYAANKFLQEPCNADS
jgi:hypothetical protein